MHISSLHGSVSFTIRNTTLAKALLSGSAIVQTLLSDARNSKGKHADGSAQPAIVRETQLEAPRCWWAASSVGLITCEQRGEKPLLNKVTSVLIGMVEERAILVYKRLVGLPNYKNTT